MNHRPSSVTYQRMPNYWLFCIPMVYTKSGSDNASVPMLMTSTTFFNKLCFLLHSRIPGRHLHFLSSMTFVKQTSTAKRQPMHTFISSVAWTPNYFRNPFQYILPVIHINIFFLFLTIFSRTGIVNSAGLPGNGEISSNGNGLVCHIKRRLSRKTQDRSHSSVLPVSNLESISQLTGSQILMNSPTREPWSLMATFRPFISRTTRLGQQNLSQQAIFIWLKKKSTLNILIQRRRWKRFVVFYSWPPYVVFTSFPEIDL